MTTAAQEAKPATDLAEHFTYVDIDRLIESPLSSRKLYDPKKIDELVESIKGVGIIEPLVVRLASHRNSKPDDLEVIAGSRRLRAAKRAELKQAPVIIRELTDEQALEIMVIENNQREDPNALEEAEGYARILKTTYGLERLAAKIGKSHKYVYDRLKLLQLVPEAKSLVLIGRITPGHAILLARLKPEDQKRAMRDGLFQYENAPLLSKLEAEKDKLAHYKAHSVRELEAWIAEHVRLDREAPIVADLFPETAAAVQQAKQEKLKVIQITHDNYVQPDAKEGNTERVYTERTWKLADGSKGNKGCDKSVLGVLVLGSDQGKTLRVCINKDCKPHWAKERREWQRRRSDGVSEEARAKEAADRARQESSWKAQQEKRESWEKARPAILELVGAKIKAASFGILSQVVYGADSAHDIRGALKLLSKPETIEDLGRALCLAILVEEANRYKAAEHFPKRAKCLGVDVDAILKTEEKPKEQAPHQKKPRRKERA